MPGGGSRVGEPDAATLRFAVHTAYTPVPYESRRALARATWFVPFSTQGQHMRNPLIHCLPSRASLIGWSQRAHVTALYSSSDTDEYLNGLVFGRGWFAVTGYLYFAERRRRATLDGVPKQQEKVNGFRGR